MRVCAFGFRLLGCLFRLISVFGFRGAAAGCCVGVFYEAALLRLEHLAITFVRSMQLVNGVMEKWAQRVDALAGAGKPCLFLVDFEQQAPQIWSMSDVSRPSISFPNFQDATPTGTEPIHPRLYAEPFSRYRFREAFGVVQAGLHRGDSFLTNLTFPIPIQLNCSLEDVYQAAQAKYRIYWPENFVCFSPETFVTINAKGYIETRPMKGTALDTPTARAALLNSRKEIAEHATIVDLLRNDLSMVAKQVRVTDYRYFHKIATSKRGLVQTSSNVGGQLPENWRQQLGTTLAKLLPAGSVSGAPKAATLSIIREAEAGIDRGYYCGIAGVFDGQAVDTCVLIRFIEPGPAGGHFFRSGGGITAQSTWKDEYAELLAKVRIPVA